MKSIHPRILAALAVSLDGIAPLSAGAQTMDYGNVDEMPSADGGSGDLPRMNRRGGGRNGTYIAPYIEAAQIFSKELSPGNDSVTYTELAAGVDTTIAGRYNALSASVRYERHIGYGQNPNNGDEISGVVRGYASVVPNAIQVEAGALATRSRIESNGNSVLAPIDSGTSVTNLYSVYGGPTVSTHAGDVKLDGYYRIGYTKIEEPNARIAAPGAVAADIFDSSTVHDSYLHAGTRPGDAGLPIGIGLGAGYFQEQITNLDQKIQDFHGRFDVTLPLGRDLALVGGVGYEDVEVSSRDALRDAGGLPVISRGRFVTDPSSPRTLAYDSEGLIWDAGVLWRPSKRTSLEAHVGKRYGSTSYYGTFAYAPNDRSSINIGVYDNVSGFGGQMNRALAALPAEFTANRDPISGELIGCVDAVDQGTCLNGALGSVRSATFRARGVAASYNHSFGRMSAGLGIGYDRRKFIAAPGTILASANGVIDENYWVAAYLKGQIDRASSYQVNAWANKFQSSSALEGDATVMGATLAYYRHLTDRLQATAAAGIQGIDRQDPLVDQWTANALVGLRYTF